MPRGLHDLVSSGIHFASTASNNCVKLMEKDGVSFMFII